MSPSWLVKFVELLQMMTSWYHSYGNFLNPLCINQTLPNKTFSSTGWPSCDSWMLPMDQFEILTNRDYASLLLSHLVGVGAEPKKKPGLWRSTSARDFSSSRCSHHSSTIVNNCPYQDAIRFQFHKLSVFEVIKQIVSSSHSKPKKKRSVGFQRLTPCREFPRILFLWVASSTRV